MAFKLVILLALAFTVQARFPKALQQRWGYLDSPEFNRNNNRVIGGNDAAPKEAPYIGSMQRNYIITKSHMCGCSLISPQTVITAAHCTDGQQVSNLVFRFGTNQRSKPGQDIKCQSINQHQNYDPNTIEHDISIVKLASPISPSDSVQIIPIMKDDVEPGSKVKLFGWGVSQENSQNLPENLQTGELTIISNEDCNKIWGEVNAIQDGMVCTTAPSTQACNGDSGGPLVFNNQLMGVVSWGPSKCPPGEYPAVFTRPNRYMDWIQSYIV